MATATSLTSGGTRNAYDAVAAGSTDSVLVAAVTGRKIRVFAYLINEGASSTAVTFNSKGAGAGAAIYAPLKYAALGGVTVLGRSFETNVGEALTVTTGAGSTTSIAVNYELVNP